MKILVLGYYGRGNLGDDTFKYIFEKLFNNVVIENTDDIAYIPHDTDVVIVGGGDLINDYFMNKIKGLLKNFKGPIYAFGVGIPYPSLIDKGYLDMFDFIIHRNPLQHQALIERYGEERVRCYPDLAYMLPQFAQEKTTNIIDSKRKNIGVFLSRSIYKTEDPESYEKIVNELVKMLKNIASQTTHRSIPCKKNQSITSIYLR